jgi:rod shape-determining protein MreC
MAAAGSDSQHRSSRTPALGLRFLVLAGISLFLLVDDHSKHHLDVVRKAIGAAVYPLRVAVDAPVSTWRWVRETTAGRNELLLENHRLQTERLLTQARLQRFTALEAENSRLRAMLEAKGRVRDQVQVAEVMSVSSNPFRHVLVIDKGTEDGVFDGQAMIDAEGVVGQVIEAGILSSQVVLISDPDHALPVQVNRNGLRTIAVGTGEFDRLELPFLPNNADIEEGDLLVTSGLGGAFPPGYPVAVIDSVIRIPQGPFADVSARPAAALNQVREIMLIWPGERDAGEEAEAGDETAPAAATGPAAEPPEPEGE